MNSTSLSRRQFLAATLGTSVVMALGPAGCSSGSARRELSEKTFSPAVLLEIDGNGDVLVNVTRAEMGQHVGTAWARIVADELGADWDRVSIKYVDSDPRWGYMVTGGSWSVNKSFFELSRTGAAGRLVLREAGAALMGVSPDQCTVSGSHVIAGDRRLSFGDIVRRGDVDRVFSAEELAALPVKPASDYRLMGTETRALDIPEKTDGSAVYGIDVERPGMVYARPVIPPARYGCEVQSVDDSEATRVQGYQGYEVLVDPSGMLQGWIVVIADSWPAAIKSADALEVKYRHGPNQSVSEADVLAEGERILSNPEEALLFVEKGDMDSARSRAQRQVSALYRTGSALHFTLEPVNAVAEFIDGVCHIHAGNQWQSLTIPALAAALEIDESDILLHTYYLGGGFGRRLNGDYCIPAALAARALGKPVKLMFTREDDTRFDCIRSPSVQHFEAAFDDSGLLGIEHRATAGWPTLALAPGFMFESLDKRGKIDPFSSSGADHWYSLPSHRVLMACNTLAQETFLPGWLRAVGAGWLGWGVEGFMDEVAVALGEDPMDLRLRLLDGAGDQAGEAPVSVGGAKRLANVLSRLRERAGWGRELPENEGLGVAACAGQERTMPTWVGCVAHVAVDRESGAINVRKLTVEVDCGVTVHPDGALAQVEGSVLWGSSLALHEGTTLEDAQVRDRNLDSYSPLRMADVPELEIGFVESPHMPVGLGEPGLIVVAPAIANAVYDAVGVRLRDLPMRPEVLREQLRARA